MSPPLAPANSTYNLEINQHAILPEVPESCLQAAPELGADHCSLEIPLKQDWWDAPTYLVRFDRKGDRFILSENNKSDVLQWTLGAQSIPSVEEYAREAIAREMRFKNSAQRAPATSLGQGTSYPKSDPNRWQIQAALALGAEGPFGDEPDYAQGLLVGLRYFNHKVLGPFGFGMGMNYWGFLPNEKDISDNLTFFPSVNVRPVKDLPVDVSAGPLLGFTEPLPNIGEFELTTGASLQINLGAPGFLHGPYVSLDFLNINLSILARPNFQSDRLGSTLLIGINPIGILNAIIYLPQLFDY